MLHVFFGNDSVRTRKETLNFLNSLLSEGQNYERLEADSYSEGVINDIVGATSLFGGHGLYFIDTPSTRKDFFDDVISSLSIFSESQNTFVILEESLLAPEKKKFAKYANNIQEFKKPATERYNVFGLTECLLKRDKRMLWVGLQEARMGGLSAEEIIGTLWWQLKSLRLAQVAGSASEAGMKDFPFSKSKRFLINFKDGEVEELSERLLTLYHEGHSGRVDIDLALEKWVLTI